MRENYAIEVGVATVCELIEILQSLPEKCRNWPVYCCGTDTFICINEEEHNIVIDMEDIFEEIENLEDFIDVKRKAFPWE